MPGSSSSDVPSTVSCMWSELKIPNMSIFRSNPEDLAIFTDCTMRKGCKGHYMMDKDENAFMIPYGFAAGDELRYTDGASMNIAISNGDKTQEEVADYCFGRIKRKNGLMRKMCNSTRPTNIVKFGIFLFLNEDGRYETCKIREGDVVVLGRNPSQGANSALPMRVMRTTHDDDSMRVPLDVCSLNDTDFDGGEDWMLKPMTRDAILETEEALERVWGPDSGESIKEKLDRLVLEAGGNTDIDSATYTTMPFEDMIDHEGGEMYDTLMLKTRSWKVMGSTSFSASYCDSWVDRSSDGIVNSTRSKHGIGKPYVDMRNSMMLGTMVIRDGSTIRIRSSSSPLIPILTAPPNLREIWTKA
ncbi:hypothetical protein MMC13_001138 [Lambiella insularis]|nr:hypothetical protein [Lambiella insularis]